MEITPTLVNAACDFLKVALEELPDDDSARRMVESMCDAFDPELKYQLLVMLLTNSMQSKLYLHPKDRLLSKKINAIKALRSCGNVTLLEGKLLVEAAEIEATALPKNIDVKRLKTELMGTGYQIV